MKRNIDILREMEKEITAFQYTDDEIYLILEAEECDFCKLYDDGDSKVEEIKEHIFKIENLLGELTEDFLNIMGYEKFDIESYKWCVGKIRYSDYEIVNYFSSFTDMIASLEYIVRENIRRYKLLTQVAYDSGDNNAER